MGQRYTSIGLTSPVYLSAHNSADKSNRQQQLTLRLLPSTTCGFGLMVIIAKDQGTICIRMLHRLHRLTALTLLIKINAFN